MEVRFTRIISLGDQGSDCEGVSRALIREGSAGVTLEAFNKQTQTRRRTWNLQKVDWLKKFEKKTGHKADGIYGKWVHEDLEPHFDALGAKYMQTWKPPPPPLIEPVQGFDSLSSTLHDIYSVGRRMDLFDLGTWNPSSTLPSGNPSDHSVHPAFAFDLGFDPDIGFQHDIARAYFYIALKRPQVEYVILGNRIGDRRTQMVNYYGYGAHENHVHVSGNR